ncbi:MAG: alpha/beta hydrolase [Pseudomonadota bacterium]|nr:alpha/beta hydrolase [Pseudomonadota bacterium]
MRFGSAAVTGKTRLERDARFQESGTEKSFRIEARDGTSIHVLTQGVGKRGTCVLLHGLGDGHYVWYPLMQRLAPFWNVAAIDLRGHGDSEWSKDGCYTAHTYTDDVVRVIESLHDEDCKALSIVGHSLGGVVAVRVAQVLQRVTALVIVDVAPEIGEEGRRKGEGDLRSGFRRYESVSEYQRFLESTRPLASSEMLMTISTQGLRASGDGGFELKADPNVLDEHQIMTEELTWAELEQVNCPVLLLRGRWSAVLKANVAMRMMSTLRRACMREVPCSGHAVMLDNPSYFCAVVEEFLCEGRLLRGDLTGTEVAIDPAPWMANHEC